MPYSREHLYQRMLFLASHCSQAVSKVVQLRYPEHSAVERQSFLKPFQNFPIAISSFTLGVESAGTRCVRK